MDLKERVVEIKGKIYRQMLDRGRLNIRLNTRAYIWGLKVFKYLPGYRAHGELLEAFYIPMRYIDDLVDGDHDREIPVECRPDYVAGRILFVRDLRNPSDEADYLMMHCFEQAHLAGEDLREEVLDILGSLHFDAKRVGSRNIFTEAELQNYFYMLDIRGTVRAALKVFRELPEKSPTLESLAVASRIYYNLRDFDEDLRVGYVNISAEDCERYGIGASDLSRCHHNHAGVRQWFKDQAERGLELLAKHEAAQSSAGFRLVTRLALPLIYVRLAKKFFERVLREGNGDLQLSSR